MLGMMQDWPLTVDKILDHAKNWHGEREVVTRSVEGPIVRTTYAAIHERARRVSNALLGWESSQATASRHWPGTPATISRPGMASWGSGPYATP